jgi:hypothetical protein
MFVILFGALSLGPTIQACINVAGTRIDGQRTESSRMIASRLRHVMKQDPAKRKAEEVYGRGTTKREIDQLAAVDEIYGDRLQRALALLQKIEKEEPGQYDTAGNLGTAYELVGDNVNALKWITEEIKLNPDAHRHSEWVHALILRAKIDAASHPERLLHQRLIDVPDRMNRDTEIMVGEETYPAGLVWESIYYQLQERMLFVKPKDPYVADLLYTLALLDANVGVVEDALQLLKLAREYGFPDESLLTQHEQQYQAIVTKARIVWWAKWGPPMFLALFFWVRWMWKHRHEKWFFWTGRQYKARLEARALAKMSETKA